MRKVIFTFLCILILFGVGSFAYYINLTPSMNKDDILIEGKVTPYDENRIMVELNIKRLKDDLTGHYVYPIAAGLRNMSFIEEEGYFTPSAVGSWWKSETILKKNNSFDQDPAGFTIPALAGEYKTKFTMEKSAEFQDMAVLYVYYLHVEERFAKDLSWGKHIALQVN